MKRTAIPTAVLVVSALIVALLAYGVLKQGDDTTIDSAIAQGKRPAAPGADIERPYLGRSGETKLADYRGKVVVLNFWTKTCGPCLEEMPEIADLTKILKDGRDDVAVLAVSTDDGPDDVKDTLKSVLREDPPFRIAFDPDQKVVAGKYGTHLYPETWIIDKNGIIRARFDGSRQWSNSAVVEMIDEIRHGGYCPIEVKDQKPSGDGAKACKEIGGLGNGS